MKVNKYLTYNEIIDNDTHKGISLEVDDLTLEEIKLGLKIIRDIKREYGSVEEWEVEGRVKVNS